MKYLLAIALAVGVAQSSNAGVYEKSISNQTGVDVLCVLLSLDTLGGGYVSEGHFRVPNHVVTRFSTYPRQFAGAYCTAASGEDRFWNNNNDPNGIDACWLQPAFTLANSSSEGVCAQAGGRMVRFSNLIGYDNWDLTW